MSSGAMVGAGVLLIILGILFISGIVQFFLTILGWMGIIAGVIVGVMGLVGMIRGNNRSSF